LPNAIRIESLSFLAKCDKPSGPGSGRTNPHVRPPSLCALAKASHYTLTLSDKLTRLLEYPELELSNNLAEGKSSKGGRFFPEFEHEDGGDASQQHYAEAGFSLDPGRGGLRHEEQYHPGTGIVAGCNPK